GRDRLRRGDAAARRGRAGLERLVPAGDLAPAEVGRGGAADLRGVPGRPAARARAPPPAQLTRVAAVDLGTNTTRLLVADVDCDRVDEVVRRGVVTGLGHGVDASRRLRPDSVGRVHAVLAEFRREADELGAERSLAAATSAVRDAANGSEFLRGVERRFGFPTRLLSGDEEAALTRRGVGAVDESTLVLDVGGGSTELILGAWH